MKQGDLFRYTDTYDIHKIGVGSIGLIVGIPQRLEGFYDVLINGVELHTTISPYRGDKMQVEI